MLLKGPVKILEISVVGVASKETGPTPSKYNLGP